MSTTRYWSSVVNILYTEDSGNATSLVRHCDHNKRNAAAINETSLSTFMSSVVMLTINILILFLWYFLIFCSFSLMSCGIQVSFIDYTMKRCQQDCYTENLEKITKLQYTTIEGCLRTEK